MREALSLGFARPVKILSSLHESSGAPPHNTLSLCGGYSLLFVSSGRLELATDGLTVSLRAGEALLVEPDDADEALLRCDGTTEFSVVQFRVRGRRQSAGVRRTPGVAGSTAKGVCRTLEVPEHVAIRSTGRMKHLLQMFREETRRGGGAALILHHLVVLMLCEMASSARIMPDSPGRGDTFEGIASRVDAYIAAHYHEPLGTPDIAAELRYNPDYLERAYRAERRISIREAIHDRRFREAQAQLLLQRGRGIAEIAAQCGYADPGYFRRVFKRATSLTPRGYRKLHAEAASRRVGRGEPYAVAAGERVSVAAVARAP